MSNIEPIIDLLEKLMVSMPNACTTAQHPYLAGVIDAFYALGKIDTEERNGLYLLYANPAALDRLFNDLKKI